MRIVKWLHLWLGLISGTVVFIVCLTACIWVFNEEILTLLEPEKNIERQRKPTLTPSQIASIARKQYPDMVVDYVYSSQGKTTTVYLDHAKDAKSHSTAILDLHPYNGQVVSHKKLLEHEYEFFDFILTGHRFLWFPYELGRPIVNYSTLVFVILLITGLIWWYPKKWNKSIRDKSFKIKWGASFKRVNLDLHNVLGFYAMIFLLCLALTGMVFGLLWFSEGTYWVTSGGDSLEEYKELESDSTRAGKHYNTLQAMDLAWSIVVKKHPEAQGFGYGFPHSSEPKEVIDITVYPNKSEFYNSTSYTFDQHTVKEVVGSGIYHTSYDKVGFAGKLRKMNYDIHVGSILGFPGKIMAFFAALIGASLPITGFLIWYGRKFKKKAKPVR